MVTTRAARSTARVFRTRAGAPPRPGCPATASADAAAARPASSGATWPGTRPELDDFASVRSDVMSSKSTNLKKRARFVVLYAFNHCNFSTSAMSGLSGRSRAQQAI